MVCDVTISTALYCTLHSKLTVLKVHVGLSTLCYTEYILFTYYSFEQFPQNLTIILTYMYSPISHISHTRLKQFQSQYEHQCMHK